MAKKWKYELNVKQYFPSQLDNNEVIPENVIDSIRDELERDGKVEEMLIEPIRKLGHVKTYADFTQWLRELYHTCDEKRIWLGQ